MAELEKYIELLTEDDKYVTFSGLHDQEFRIRRYLTTSELSFLVANYVNDYFNGLTLEDGSTLKEEISKNAFNPNYAHRQFHIHLANLLLGWELNGDQATKLEEVGFFDSLVFGCYNATDVLDRAREVIDRELSVGYVVQAFLTKAMSLIPEPAQLQDMIGEFAEQLNKVAPDRLPFIGELMGNKPQ